MHSNKRNSLSVKEHDLINVLFNFQVIDIQFSFYVLYISNSAYAEDMVTVKYLSAGSCPQIAQIYWLNTMQNILSTLLQSLADKHKIEQRIENSPQDMDRSDPIRVWNNLLTSKKRT